MIIKKYFTKSVKRITKDFKQKELLPLKLVFFVQATTIAVLYPYLTLHMRELGINVEEAAIMSAVIPVIGIIMPPLAGMVADKIGNFKLLLSFFSLIGGAVSLLLLLVPVGRITIKYPEKITFDFGCNGAGENILGNSSLGHLQLRFSSEIPCDQVQNANVSDKNYNLEFSLEGCGFVCTSVEDNSDFQPQFLSEENSTNPTDPILRGRSYAIQIKTGSVTESYRFNLTTDDVPKMKTKEDALSHRIMASDDRLKKSIRRVAPSRYFFPAAELSQLNCKKVSDESGGKEEAEERFVCEIGAAEDTNEILPLEKEPMTFSLNKLEGSDETISFRGESLTWTSNESLPVVCTKSNFKENKKISTFVYFHNPENNLEILETYSLTKCEPRCLLSSMRKALCTNTKADVLFNPQLTFWTYLIIRVLIGIIGETYLKLWALPNVASHILDLQKIFVNIAVFAAAKVIFFDFGSHLYSACSTSYAMYEVAVIAILREHKADYGLQRIYASIGGMISSPVSGALISYASQGKDYTDFRPAFYLYAGLKIATCILMLFINLEFKKAASNVVKDAITVLKNLEIIALLAACFVLGTAWGYIESFLFWFLEDLGGTTSLMGLTITVGGIAGIPLLILSGPIIDKIGHANVLFIGFIFYAIRLVGYSVIYNPYQCLYFEAMESITSSLAITAAITYAAKLSTTTTDGSVQGLVGGLYFGVGRGAGSLIGGYLMKAFGTRETYRIFAVFSVITGIVYYLFNQFYLIKRPQRVGNEICKKEPKPKKNAESDLKNITNKPKIEHLGAAFLENNNMTTEKEVDKVAENKNISVLSEEKRKEDEETGKETESHNNQVYIHDEDTKKVENEEEMKEKQTERK